MITDGYVPSWGTDWNAPTLWIVVDNAMATSTIGKTIHVNEVDYD